MPELRIDNRQEENHVAVSIIKKGKVISWKDPKKPINLCNFSLRKIISELKGVKDEELSHMKSQQPGDWTRHSCTVNDGNNGCMNGIGLRR